MTDTLAQARETIARGSKSFAAASRLLPPATRDDVVRLYFWCRHCDDVVDGQVLGGELEALSAAEQRRRLDALERDTHRALRTQAPVPPPFQALREVARAHDFPDRWPLDLLEGFRMDVERRAYRTLDDVMLYCYHVAGVVGLMMARVMGARDPEVLDRACDLGLAFQLTNIARDVVEDARAGRSYLPAEWLDGPVDPDDERTWVGAHRAALRLLEVADAHYESARYGLTQLPWRCGWAIAAALRIYRAIGEKVRAGDQTVWRGRPGTGAARKIGLIAQAANDPIRYAPLVAHGGRARPFVVHAPPRRQGLWTRADALRDYQTSS